MDKSKTVSYYDVLQVTREASDEDIKRAFRKLAMRYHPDHNPKNKRHSQDRFCLINEAYRNLKTKEKRAYYNQKSKPDNDNAPREYWFNQMARAFRGQE